MKKYLTLALLLLTVGSFAQTKDTTLNSGLIYGNILTGVSLWEFPSTITFSGGNNGGFTIDFKNDSMIVKSEIPMNEAGMLLAKFAMQYYTHYTDSLKNEIKWRDEVLELFIQHIPLSKLGELVLFLDKKWLSEQKKEFKSIIKCGYQHQH